MLHRLGSLQSFPIGNGAEGQTQAVPFVNAVFNYDS